MKIDSSEGTWYERYVRCDAQDMRWLLLVIPIMCTHEENEGKVSFTKKVMKIRLNWRVKTGFSKKSMYLLYCIVLRYTSQDCAIDMVLEVEKLSIINKEEKSHNLFSLNFKLFESSALMFLNHPQKLVSCQYPVSLFSLVSM